MALRLSGLFSTGNVVNIYPTKVSADAENGLNKTLKKH
jgi:hypothetical protein